jgi:hypothetical protein
MKRLRDAKTWQNAFACLLIAHLLIVVALAACPQLHQLLHNGAEHRDHECAVTVMISGGTDGSCGSPVFDASAILPITFGSLPDVHSREVAPLFLSAHVLEHAPPIV